jgi:NodT family efflux transporter outer membrane factor (OMF) lipoprotein
LKFYKIILIFLFALYFNGCVPKVDTPKMLNLNEQDKNTTELYWWKNSNDDKLIQLILLGIKSSPDMKIAEKRIYEAMNDIEIAGAGASPDIYLSSYGNANSPSYNDLLSPPFVPKKYNLANIALNASYDIDFWGKNRSKINSKIGGLEAKKAEYKNAVLTLSTAIADEYFRYGYLMSINDILKNELDVLNENIMLLNKRFDRGIDSKNNIYLYEAKASDISNMIVSNNIAIINSKKILANLVGTSISDVESFLPTKFIMSNFFTNAPKITTNDLASKPQIEVKKAVVYASRANLDTAKAGFYPDVTLNGLFGLSSLGFNNLFLSSSKTSSYGASIYLPIFDRNSIEGNYKTANDELSIAIYDYNKEVMRSINETISSIRNFEEAKKQLIFGQVGLQAETKNMVLLQKNYQAGIIDKFPLLSQKLIKIQSSKNVLDAQLSLALSFDNMIRAEGGIPKGEK